MINRITLKLSKHSNSPLWMSILRSTVQNISILYKNLIGPKKSKGKLSAIPLLTVMFATSIGSSLLKKLANLKLFSLILHGESKVPSRMIHSLCSQTVSSLCNTIQWPIVKLVEFLCIYWQTKVSSSCGY